MIAAHLKSRLRDLIIFAVVSSLYILNQIWLKKVTNGIVNYFLLCHFNDLIAPVFMLSLFNLIVPFAEKRIEKLRLILIVCVFAALVWEFIVPLFRKDSVTDMIDVACYILGGILYWIITVALNQK